MDKRYGANGQVYLGTSHNEPTDLTTEVIEEITGIDLGPLEPIKINWENVDGESN